jgi:hypothetical protein
MVWTCHFKKFHEMVFRLPCLALKIALSDQDILLVGVIHFLVIIVAVGSDYDPTGVPLLPLFPTFSALLCAFASGFEWRCLPATNDHFPIA